MWEDHVPKVPVGSDDSIEEGVRPKGTSLVRGKPGTIISYGSFVTRGNVLLSQMQGLVSPQRPVMPKQVMPSPTGHVLP